MKVHQLKRLAPHLSRLGLAGLALALAVNGGAATILWGPAQPIGGEGDVVTNGILVEADAAGNAASLSVNGVTFAAWPGNSAHLAPGSAGVTLQSGGFGSANAPFSDLSANYQSLLSAALSEGIPGALVLSNLTAGTSYEVEVWANDAVGDSGALAIDGQTTLFYDNAAVVGEPGSYALGTFMADGATQTISLIATNGAATAIVNALQLRSISAGAPVVLGIAASPTNQTLAVANVVLSSVATGTDLSYQWLTDGGNPGQWTSVSGAVGATLAIDGVGVGLTNNYALVVSNSSGAATSAVIRVTLIGAPAEGITWGPAMNISGDSDVSTNGAGLLACQANIYSNLTVNGVTFRQFLPVDYYTHPEANDYGANVAVDGVTNDNGTATLSDGDGAVYYFNYGNYPGYGWTVAPFTNLSTNYQAVLAGGLGGLGSDDMLTLVLSNLYPGAIYGLQCWVNDSRSCCITRDETFGDLFGDTVDVVYNAPEELGGTGQYVLGEGVADASGSMTVTMFAPGTFQQINAFQLRSPSLFPPYLLPVQISPSNFVYAGAQVSFAGGAVSPVGVTTTYQWQWNQGAGDTFVALTGGGANTATFSLDTSGMATGAYLYRLVAGNIYGTNTTQPVTLSVDAISPPLISGLTPSSATLYPHATPLTLSATVDGSRPLAIQWFWDAGHGTGVFVSVPGATTNSLTVNPGSLNANATYSYELVASNFLGVATSAPVTVTIAALPQAPAQGVSWGPVGLARDDSDIATNGVGVLALVANSPVSVNGVAFHPFIPAGVTLPQGPGSYYQGSETSITAGTNGVTATLTSPNSTSPNSPFYWYNGFTSIRPPFSLLSPAYQTLLAGGDGAPSGPDPWLLSVTGLAPGSNYLFQFWVNDPRGFGELADRFEVLSDGGSDPTSLSDPLQYETPLAGGAGSYVIGATKADESGDINITILGSDETQVNAFQLRRLTSPGANVPPLLSDPQPAQVVEYVGQTGTVSVGVVPTGSEPLSYQWFGAGRGGALSAVLGATNILLSLNTAGYAAGSYQYQLVASNTVGTATSAVASVTVVPIPAAPSNGIVWGPAANIVGDSDVATAGATVIALVANNPLTLNGVNFASFVPADADLTSGSDFPSQDTLISATNGAVIVSLTSPNSGSTTPFYWYAAFGENGAPFDDLSTNYQNLLTGGDGAWTGTNVWALTCSGLVPGHTYEIQFWADDSRQYGFGRNDLLADAFGDPTVTLEFNSSPTGANGGLGQFAMGVGKADGAGNLSFSVTGGDTEGFSGPDGQINAMQVRDLSVGSSRVTLTIAVNGANVTLSWSVAAQQLLQAPTVLGPWTTNAGATSPYTVPASNSQEYFKLKAD